MLVLRIDPGACAVLAIVFAIALALRFVLGLAPLPAAALAVAVYLAVWLLAAAATRYNGRETE